MPCGVGYSTAHGVVISLRGTMVLLATLIVLITSVAISALVLTSTRRNLDALDREAQFAVDEFATSMLQLSLDGAATNITAYFGSLADLSQYYLLHFRRNAITSLDPNTFLGLVSLGQLVLTAFRAPTAVVAVSPDGTGVVVSTSPVKVWTNISIEGGTPVVYSTLWKDPLAALKYDPSRVRPFDLRQLPSFQLAKQLPPNTFGWAPPIYSTDFAQVWFQLATPFFARPDQATMNFVLSTGCDTGWISSLLRDSTKPSGSIALLLTNSNIILGTSRGTVIDKNRLVDATESSDAVIRQTVLGCPKLNAGTRYTSIANRPHLCGSRPITDQYGLNLRFLLATPKEHFNGKLERSWQDARNRATRGTRATLGLCLAVLFFAFVTAVAVAFLVSRPLQAMAAGLGHVADLQLDLAPPPAFAQPSRFTEVRQIQEQFLAMVKRLREYKAFIPNAVFADDKDVLTTEIDFSGLYGGSDRRVPPFLTATSSSSLSDVQQERWGGRALPVNRRELGIGLQDRTGSAAVFELLSASPLLGGRHLRQLVSLFAEFTDAIAEIARATSASVDVHCGDRVFLSWNTFYAKATHRTASCRAVVQLLHKTLPATNSKLRELDLDAVECRAGISSGRLTFGRIGSETMRVCAVLGQAVDRAAAIARHSPYRALALVVGKELVEEAGMHLRLHPLDIVTFAPTEEPFVIYELGSEHQQQATEWMYSLSDQQADKPLYHLQQGFEMVRKRDFVAAHDHLQALPANDGWDADPCVPSAQARRRLEHMIRTKQQLPFALFVSGPPQRDPPTPAWRNRCGEPSSPCLPRLAPE